MLKYIGNGDFVTGIPARDLTEDEVESFGGEQALLATGLYQSDPSDAPTLKKGKRAEQESEA
jgi:hypothetical protein